MTGETPPPHAVRVPIPALNSKNPSRTVGRVNVVDSPKRVTVPEKCD